MRILYFLDPAIELNNPLFRFATLRNSLLPQIIALRKGGHEVVIALSDAIAQASARSGHDRHLGSIAVLDCVRWTGGQSAQFRTHRRLAHPADAAEVGGFAALIREALPPSFEPDLIIIWESASNWLQEVFPAARLVYQMPGFFSRPPFPNLISHDVGMLAGSTSAEPLRSEHELQKLQELRERDRRFLTASSSLSRHVAEAKSRFANVVLLPLQVDDYFMVTGPLGSDRTQLEYVISALESAPADTGIWVTNYRSRDLHTTTLSDDAISFLRSRFDNFIFHSETDSTPSASQFLAPVLDGIITISSSVGYQAAYWEKPLFAESGTHITAYRTADRLEEFFDQARRKVPINQDPCILGALLYRNLPASFMAKAEYGAWLESYASTGTFPAWTSDSLIDALSLERRERDALGGPRYFDRVRNEVRIDHCRELSDQIARHDVVSFDIFDTLLYRPFAKPTDLFDFLEERARLIVGNPGFDFKSERRAAEQASFAKAIADGLGETTLDEIYAVLQLNLGLSDATKAALMALEVEWEEAFLYPRMSGYSAYQEAQALGKTIVIASDMYLPEEVLHRILARNGYVGYKHLFVSSTHRLKKQSGQLFHVILETLAVEPARILHIGDNVIADVRQPKALGIKAFHLPKANEAFQASEGFGQLWKRDADRHSLSWSIVLALTGQRLHDNTYFQHQKGTLFDGDAWRLGYYGLGPLLFGFAKWLLDRSRSDGIQDLYFLARDGKVMRSAFELVSKGVVDAPRSHYLLCSRRAVNLAKVSNFSDLMDLLHVDFASGTSLGHLLNSRFGALQEDIESDSLAQHGLSWNSRISKESLPVLRKLFADIAPALLKIAANERTAYISYLDSAGIFRSSRSAVVDIGYAGTMQESLNQLGGEASSIGGYYLMTFRPALRRIANKGHAIQAFLGDFVDRHDTYHPFCRHVPLFETLFSSTETSLIRMRTTASGKLKPVYAERMKLEAKREQLVAVVQSGAIDFVREAMTVLGPALSDLDLEPNKCLRVLTHYFADPHPEDARILAGVAFEDAYGGKSTLILPEDGDLDEPCIWQQGLQACRQELAGTGPDKTARHTVRNSKGQLSFGNAAVDSVLARLLGEKKLRKLQNRPNQFFSDSRSRVVRRIGKIYCRAYRLS